MKIFSLIFAMFLVGCSSVPDKNTSMEYQTCFNFCSASQDPTQPKDSGFCANICKVNIDKERV